MERFCHKDEYKVKEEGDSVMKKKRQTRKIIVMSITIIIFLMILISFAWYLYVVKRPLNTQESQIRVPYYLYILDKDKSDYFSFDIVNLHPAETKQVIFCVSNQDKQGSPTYNPGRETAFDYELELAYTQNMPITYTLYEVKLDEVQEEEPHDEFSVCVDGTWWKKTYGMLNPPYLGVNEVKSIQITKDNNTEMYGDDWENIINKAMYQVYSMETPGVERLNLSVGKDSSGSTLYDYDYYMLEIKWQENADYVEYLKETDLIYVKVNAIQARPELAN